MQKQQRGVTIMGLLLILVLFIVVALFAIDAVARQGMTNSAEVRRSFENRATIDNIVSVRPQDLEITREGNSVVIGFAYRKEIPLFTGVGLYIDYAASSKGQ